MYLYYTNSFGARPTFTVLFNDKETVKLEKKARIKYKIYSTGDIKISCYYGIEKNVKLGESSVTLNIQHGGNYYVKLYNTYLKLVKVDEITGEQEFNDPKLSGIQNLNEDIMDPFIKKEIARVEPVKKEQAISDVDIDIPVSKKVKSNTYALIIGNEDYSSFQTGLSTEVNVDYAINDARIFREYCVKTLGIPDKQVKLLTNATAGQMPVDISGNNVALAIKLADVYSKLNEFPSKKVSVFLDACFSGGGRNLTRKTQTPQCNYSPIIENVWSHWTIR